MNFYLNFASGERDSRLDNMISVSHFDFRSSLNLMLVVGPMGSGKTEYAARIYKDSLVIKNKSLKILNSITKGSRNRANVFFIRNVLDRKRFKDCPENGIPYRGGVVDGVSGVGFSGNSFDVEKIVEDNSQYGTFVIDEACFYEERLVFVLSRLALDLDILFVLPTLIYNFRKEIFNNTAKLLIEYSDKVCRIGAYCEHDSCMDESFLTYRYYFYEGQEIAAPYFDPLLIVGGDGIVESAIYPNYAARCSKHHYLVGREYFFTVLKPFALLYVQGDKELFEREILCLNSGKCSSTFESSLSTEARGKCEIEVLNNLFKLPFLAERALITLALEYNILSRDDFKELVSKFSLNRDYIQKIFVSKDQKESFGIP
ncbi:thymidine kinase [Borrelia sp. RT1S]|uniref:thymidine kinase n=1 Tax=Borrelia sp. RT1S TaxID=2898580 RepID=UPI001E64A1E8|nr:thymidine kinase [Borrelia sp. RT1S]UGQ17564.1 thymidine kinase [Borrelia sp. RT1S]